MTALYAGYQAARRVYTDPSRATLHRDYEQQQAHYHLLWSYYDNTMFDRVASVMQAYRRRYGLYKHTRDLYNPTARAVDFWNEHLYPGVLSEDGSILPESVRLAIPFAKDTAPALTRAIAQSWQWSNFGEQLGLITTFCPALGSVLVEVTDDLLRSKVLSSVIWPGHVRDLVLDGAGNVQAYTLEYQTIDSDDPDRELYTYRKEVSKVEFRYYRNNEPYDYGNGAVVENPYGFVPACWFRHRNVGEDVGSSVIARCISKVDELNSQVSLIHDQIAKVVRAPLAIWSNYPIDQLFAAAKAPVTTEAERNADRESQVTIKGPADGRVDKLAGDLPLGEAVLYVDRLLAEIEKDLPEVKFYQELRAMTQVTGPAANILSGDVTDRVVKIASFYDVQLIKHFQMLLAIGGFRANSGAWGPLTTQQQLFTPFDLDSYERGLLNFAIMPRELIAQTTTEKMQARMLKWQAVKAAVDAGSSLAFALQDAGFTEEEIAQVMTEREQEQAQEQVRQEQQLKMQQAMMQQNAMPAQK